MDKNTQETLENVIKITKRLLNEKYENRKRLSQEELWEQATTLRDIAEIERWLVKSNSKFSRTC